MGIHTVHNAVALLKREGLLRFLKESARRFGFGAPRPDEADIVFRAFQSLNRRGLMVDVGAHFGSALKPFALSGWSVFAFEPDPLNREKLVEAFGSSSNVSIDPRGVSDQPRASVPFYTSAVSTGISGLSAFHESHLPTTTVDLTTLDSFFSEHGVTHVDFLKVDTEGFDLFVLRGCPWTRIAPDVVLCEFEDFKTKPLGYSFHELAAFLQRQGYRLLVSEWKPIREYGTLHDWSRFVVYPCELQTARAWGNILAAKEDSVFEALVRECGRSRRVEGL